MKKLLIFLVIVSAGIGIYYYQETSICRSPLAYDIGSFDTRFNISKDKFIKTTKEAETIWEKGLGRELFNYEPETKFKINLVFDQRQSQTIQANQSKEVIQGSRDQYDLLVAEYKLDSANYERDLADYNADISAFELKLNSYNNQVAKLNSQGGAKPDQYRQLEALRRELEQEKNSLDSRRIALNQAAANLNALGDKVNALASELNIEVDIHNQRFGEAREFDQGDYSGNRINIYQFEGISDLRLVLAHELGHALGLNHVENPKSIMYYLMDKQDLNNPVPSKEDIQAFITRCTLHIPKLKDITGLFLHALRIRQSPY